MIKRFSIILFLSLLVVSLVVGCSGKETPPMESSTPAESPSMPSPPSSQPPPSPSIPTQLTMLSITEGKVFVLKSGTDSWIEAQVGMTLQPSDTIKADNDSRSVITFFEGSTIDLQAGTQVEVVTLNFAGDSGPTRIRLRQEIGNTISRVKKFADPASLYEIETPAGVAVVRGSVMQLIVIRSGTASISNLGGNIWVIAQGIELRVPEGRQAIIIPGKIPFLQYLGGY